MSYDETQKTLQHKRKMERRIRQNTEQISFLRATAKDHESRVYTHEIDRVYTLNLLREAIDHLTYVNSRLERYLNRGKV